jgi:ribosomal protein S27E
MTMFQNLRRMMSGAATLKITCEACGHEATWTGAQAFQRLACALCGAWGRAHVWI